ncbi:N-acetylmuramoyl-L-alanine amidase CwlH precursor [Acholeplasma oculi]|uniref:N-acetylmuramoyl-L-alanine amidase n=1 Tax=Acholeplasma oculi TaxID=35623 RepID=A0A061AI57_9MOLU|nr:Ig-like domain-containing protein [Acholeplasma oculi]CDR31266.1 putative surface-anchored pectin lyase and N-acetylmuramoyl-L-alanine amidase [Acholeplasma oculi]SKC38499.1 N-acetylmuramoyl-L-alanine amidase [Acholeplasma oculi]SUT91407.1 N-acetylmuramoyl-L-alanine amidase CwlH precursor [Acholeplasma oculi]
MRKIFVSLLMLMTIMTVAACTDAVALTLTVSDTEVSIKEGETFQLEVETNDPEGYVFELSNSNVASISDEGLITGLLHGTVELSVISQSDENLFETVTITVTKDVTIDVAEVHDVLWVGLTIELEVTSNDTYQMSSSNEQIATVSNDGLVTGVSSGEVTITVTSVLDSNVKKSITLTVYDQVQSIVLSGSAKENVGTSRKLTVNLLPTITPPLLNWSVSDQDIATIDDEGNLSFLKEGVVTVTATSVTNDEVTSSYEIEVFNEVVIDASKGSGDEVTIDGLTFKFGERLFANTEALADALSEGLTVKLYDGTYDQAIEINDASIQFIGMTEAVRWTKKITVDAENIKIDNILFTELGSIEATDLASGLIITKSSFENLNTEVDAAIKIQQASHVTITENIFTNVKQAISILDIKEGLQLLSKNIIYGVEDAIYVEGSTYDSTAKLHVLRNDVTDALRPITVLLKDDMEAIVRFNAFNDYETFAAKSNVVSDVDFTLNYWGSETLDLNDFIDIEERMLLGNYATKQAIILEKDYDPEIPVFVFITSQIDALQVKENQLIQFEYLPYELNNARFRFITDDSEVLMIEQTGMLIPKRSGSATITVRSSRASSVQASILIEVTTDPGIDFVPSTNTSALLVGDPITLEATPFPVTISDQTVIYESSNPSIATIDSEGVVTSLQAGSVIITAKLQSDPLVKSEFYLTFYSSLDENNLLDLLTQNQVSFTEHHRFFAIGNGLTYEYSAYESVSLFYFDEIEVNTTKMIPDQYKGGRVRPGTKKSAIPAPYTSYNPDNVYWITVHDTANTDPSSSALSHANYLLGQAIANGAQVSWNYTIDDYEMYQHIPEDEVTYHAGDGSNLVGQGSYLGGGNRNAISIEMNVGMGDDLYRIWQRTAKFSAQALVRYNLPREHIKFHQHFSGKHCPNTMLTAGLDPKFQKMADVEYKVASEFSDAEISFVSSNPEIIDHAGRVIQMPDHATNVSYTITVLVNGIESSRTFNVYIPGTIR